jgi:hypothetical protein
MTRLDVHANSALPDADRGAAGLAADRINVDADAALAYVDGRAPGLAMSSVDMDTAPADVHGRASGCVYE